MHYLPEISVRKILTYNYCIPYLQFDSEAIHRPKLLRIHCIY